MKLFRNRHSKRDLSTRRFTSQYYSLFRNDGHTVTEIAIAAIFSNLLSLVFPIFVLIIIDRVIVHNGIDTLDILFLALIVTALFDLVLSTARTLILRRYEAISEHEMAVAMLAHLVRLPLSVTKSKGVAEALTYLRDIKTVKGAPIRFVVVPVVDAIFAVVMMVLLLIISPNLFMIASLAIPAYLIVTILASLRQRRAINTRTQRQRGEQASVVSMLSGIETIRATGSEASFLNKWQASSIAAKRAELGVSTVGTVSSSITAFVQKALAATVLWLGAQLVILGELTLGQLIAFNLLALRLHAPIGSISRSVLTFFQTKASSERLRQLALQPPENLRKPMLYIPDTIKGNIEFNNVSFRYGDDKPHTLNEVTFSVQAGQSVALVGASGSGKSTILGLLMGFLNPSSGDIKIDGRSLQDFDKKGYRRLVGYVPQGHYIFGKSIAENVALGANKINYDRVVEVCEAAFAADFIEDLPRRYSTILSEGGLELSGGQRQRIALARALYHDPKILLLDEISSGLDAYAEDHIRQSLGSYAKDRTLLVATHRTGLLQDMDEIISLDAGVVSQRLALASQQEK